MRHIAGVMKRVSPTASLIPGHLQKLHVQPDTREVTRLERCSLDAVMQDTSARPVHRGIVGTSHLQEQTPTPHSLALNLQATRVVGLDLFIRHATRGGIAFH